MASATVNSPLCRPSHPYPDSSSHIKVAVAGVAGTWAWEGSHIWLSHAAKQLCMRDLGVGVGGESITTVYPLHFCMIWIYYTLQK